PRCRCGSIKALRRRKCRKESMTDLKRILVVIDPTASFHPCLERAAWLARCTKARVELFISDHAPHLEGEPSSAASTADARATAMERHRARLEQLAAPLRAEGTAVDVDVQWEYPLHDSIVRKALASGADLVLKDTHFHPVLKRTIFSNT